MTEVARDWYRTFFAEGFWAVAEVEYSPERTATEVAYLADVLRELAPGTRVADLGCGKGRFSRTLSVLGARVVGLDLSAAMLREATGVDRVRGSARRLPFGAECWIHTSSKSSPG